MTTAGDATPARLREQPTWLISQVGALAHRLLTDRLAAAGARGYHYRLLAALQESGPGSQAQLGRRARLDRSDVAAALDELAGQGHITRSPDPADRRRNIITITPAGRRQLQRLDELLAGIQAELLAPLSASQRRQLILLLSQVLDGHPRPGSRPPAR